jgi:hypothetical protein
MRLLQVEHRADPADARQVDVVHDEPDRRVRRALVLLQLADAAQLEIARPRAVARIVHVGHQRDEFLDVLQCGRGDRLAVQHRQRCAEVQRLGVAECGDHDLLEGAGRHRRLFGGLGPAGGRQRERSHQCRQQDCLVAHVQDLNRFRDPVEPSAGIFSRNFLFLRRH